MTIVPSAQDQDYVEIQGGKPNHFLDGKLLVVHHNYEGGEGLVVRTHTDQGEVVIETSRGPRLFNANFLKSTGIFLETQSISRGGQGYPRVTNEGLFGFMHDADCGEMRRR